MTTDIIYDPNTDSWDDDSRELLHDELGQPRLQRWMLTAKALELDCVLFMGVKQRET